MLHAIRVRVVRDQGISGSGAELQFGFVVELSGHFSLLQLLDRNVGWFCRSRYRLRATSLSKDPRMLPHISLPPVPRLEHRDQK
ncbi:MAG: hypothetical protein [Caudoviricetes sp.]|nr:MAG: hypothetical protein [Caudoviricetes sp.]